MGHALTGPRTRTDPPHRPYLGASAPPSVTAHVRVVFSAMTMDSPPGPGGTPITAKND